MFSIKVKARPIKGRSKEKVFRCCRAMGIRKMWSHCFDVEAEAKSNDSPTVSVVEVIDSMILLFKTKRRVKNSVVVTSSNNAENYLWMKRAFMEFTLRKYSKKFSFFIFTT